MLYGSSGCPGDAGGAVARADLAGGEAEKVASLRNRAGCGQLVARTPGAAAGQLSAPQSDLADAPLPFDGSLLWDPGDRSLLFSSHRGSHATAIFLDEDDRQAPFFESITDLEDVSFSPTGRKLLFVSADATNDPQSPCYHRGSFDGWSFQSLLNLTADLRIRRSTRAAAASCSKGRRRTCTSPATCWSTPAPRRPTTGGPWPRPAATGARRPFHHLGGARYGRLAGAADGGGPGRQPAEPHQAGELGRHAEPHDLYASPDYISPNGDGVQDAWTVHYRVLAPVHLTFRIFDETGAVVRTLERDHSVPGSELDLAWDGRDDRGLTVPDGLYRLTVQGYEFFVVVDTTPPKVTIAATPLQSCGSASPFVSFRVEELNFDLADRSLVVPSTATARLPPPGCRRTTS